MKSLKSLMRISFLFILALTVNMSCAQDMEAVIDELIQSNYTADAPGISLLVAKGGEPIYRKAFGMANLELGVNMNSDHLVEKFVA